MSENPWMKFYPRDWRGDQSLRAVSLAARGLWMECLCLMHEAKPYGHLLLAGQPVGNDVLSRMVGTPLDEIAALLAELEKAGVFSRTAKGVIYSRRMTKDFQASRTGKKSAEKRWSQPVEKKGEKVDPNGYPIGLPNGYPNAQSPEGRIQKAVVVASGDPPPAPAITTAAAGSIDLEERRSRERRSVYVDQAVDLHRRICERMGSPKGYRSDLGTVVGWLEQGIAGEEIMAGIEDVLGRNGGQLVTTLRYFEGAIGDRHRRGARASPATNGKRPTDSRVINWETATEADWRQRLEFWARQVAKHGTDQRRWPEFARWRESFGLGPSPDQSGCLAPPGMVASALQAAGLDPGFLADERLAVSGRGG